MLLFFRGWALILGGWPLLFRGWPLFFWGVAPPFWGWPLLARRLAPPFTRVALHKEEKSWVPVGFQEPNYCMYDNVYIVSKPDGFLYFFF